MGACGSKVNIILPEKSDEDCYYTIDQQVDCQVSNTRLRLSRLSSLSFPEVYSTQNHQNNIGDNILVVGKTMSGKNQNKNMNSHSLFIDSEFSPNQDSITKNIQKFEIGRNIKWKRPFEFMNGLISVFQDRIQSKDIIQGKLGDCYFLSALSVMAEHQNLIERLFITRDITRNGKYDIWLCVNGIFQQITIDDYIPCFLDGSTIFSKAKENELWMLLLEKAYAKVYGSYEKLMSGVVGNAFRDLTGAPSIVLTIEPDKKSCCQECWLEITESLRQGYLVCCGTQACQPGSSTKLESGLVSSHAYAILDARSVIGSDGSMDNIIKIRNPWGKYEWNGSWSDQCSLWTEQMRQELGINVSNDGVFWMSIKDFVQEFYQITICKLHANYKYIGKEIKISPNSDSTKCTMLMKVDEDLHCYCGVSQLDGKLQQEGVSTSHISMIMVKVNEDYEIEKVIGDASSTSRDIFVEGHLKKGLYLIYIEADWQLGSQKYLTISSYGEHGVSFKQYPVNHQKLINEIIKVDSLNGNRINYVDKIYRYEGIVGGYLYYYYINESKKQVLKETLTFEEMSNIYLCSPTIIDSPTNNGQILKVILKQGQQQIIKLKNQGISYDLEVNRKHIIETNYNNIQLHSLALNEPTLIKERSIDNKKIQVQVNQFEYENGCALLYLNNSNQTYEEEVTFTLDNLSINRMTGKVDMKIVVEPYKDHLVRMDVVDKEKKSRIQSNLKFSLQQ